MIFALLQKRKLRFRELSNFSWYMTLVTEHQDLLPAGCVFLTFGIFVQEVSPPFTPTRIPALLSGNVCVVSDYLTKIN